ncbi:MAG: hypothetical protein R3C11_00610 [Planctomycetaceae bacterium]
MIDPQVENLCLRVRFSSCDLSQLTSLCFGEFLFEEGGAAATGGNNRKLPPKF